jgi:hypothetical protein
MIQKLKKLYLNGSKDVLFIFDEIFQCHALQYNGYCWLLSEKEAKEIETEKNQKKKLTGF